jgi:putative tricarboxylic transport membrane protein
MDETKRRVPGELVFAQLMLLFGLTALWLSWRISGFSSWSSPGMLPMLATATMTASAFVILVKTMRVKGPDTSPDNPLSKQFFHQITPLPIVLFTVMIIIYMTTLEYLGFIVSSFVYLVGSMVALGDRRIGRVMVISAISLAVIYLIFQTAFSVVLPEGVLRGVLR